MSDKYGPRRLTLTCAEHGHLHETVVYCQHETDDTIRSVQHAHGAKYGADCHSTLHVHLLDDVRLCAECGDPVARLEEWTDGTRRGHKDCIEGVKA